MLIFGCQKAERALTLITLFDHPPRSINPDPPQSGPVLVIVVHEERERRICLQILESAQDERRFGLGVYRGVHGAGVQEEATRDDVRSNVGGHRGQMPDPCVGQSLPRYSAIHDTRIYRALPTRWRRSLRLPVSHPVSDGQPVHRSTCSVPLIGDSRCEKSGSACLLSRKLLIGNWRDHPKTAVVSGPVVVERLDPVEDRRR